MNTITTILDGDFWTADRRRPWAASIGIDAQGKIAAVETEPAKLAMAFPNAVHFQLPNGSLGVPGFHDAHNHLGFAAFAHAESLVGVTSRETILQRLLQRAKKSSEGWIIGFGWNTGLTADVTQSDLDGVAANRPVAVFDKGTHAVQLNRAAVREIEPAFGAAVAEGHPGTLENGRLLETSSLVFGAMRIPDAALEETLIDFERYHLSLGITSIDDLDVLSSQVLESLQRAYAANRMTMACHAFLDFGRFREDAIPEPMSTGSFRIVGMKSYVDGAFGARSAAMREPFLGAGGRGIQLLNGERFERRWKRAVELGYRHLALHAIGDHAVAEATRFLSSAAKGKNFDRLRIEHYQLAEDEDRKACADAGIAICMQPNFISDVHDYADRLGDRAMKLCEHRSALDSGVLLGFGSDGMPTGPVHGLRCAVEHPNESQRITVEESLRAYTIDACRISLTDDVRGSLSVGKEANIAILSRNIVKENRIASDVQVLATLLNGRLRFETHPGVPSGERAERASADRQAS
jgi:predicted amidohydrolase YtcJ